MHPSIVLYLLYRVIRSLVLNKSARRQAFIFSLRGTQIRHPWFLSFYHFYRLIVYHFIILPVPLYRVAILSFYRFIILPCIILIVYHFIILSVPLYRVVILSCYRFIILPCTMFIVYRFTVLPFYHFFIIYFEVLFYHLFCRIMILARMLARLSIPSARRFPMFSNSIALSSFRRRKMTARDKIKICCVIRQPRFAPLALASRGNSLLIPDSLQHSSLPLPLRSAFQSNLKNWYSYEWFVPLKGYIRFIRAWLKRSIGLARAH